MATQITYNGITIARLKGGQKATLVCDDKKMKSDITVRVSGNSGGIDTSDATATADKILKDETAYVNDEKVTGSIETYDGVTTTEDDGIVGTWILNENISGLGSTLHFDSNEIDATGYSYDGMLPIKSRISHIYLFHNNVSGADLNIMFTGGDFMPPETYYYPDNKISTYDGDANDYVFEKTSSEGKLLRTFTIHQLGTSISQTALELLTTWLKANATKQGGISMTSPNGILLDTERKYVDRPIKVVPTLEEKTVTPTTEEQVIVASDGYVGMSKVIVGAVPETEEWDGSGVVIEEIASASLISFAINGTSYQAEEGMTWGQFINSKYNPTTIPRCEVIGLTGVGYAWDEYNTWIVMIPNSSYDVLTTDIIKPIEYTISNPSSGGGSN